MCLSRPAFYSALGSCLIHGLTLGFAAMLIVSGPQAPPSSIKVTLVERAVPLPIAEGAVGKESESKPVEKPAPLPPPQPEPTPKLKPITKSRKAPSPPKIVKPPVAPPPAPEPPKVQTQTPVSTLVEESDAVDEKALALPTEPVLQHGGGLLSGGTPSPTTQSGGTGGGAKSVAQPDYGVNPKPPYPMLARRLGAQGVVLLRVHVRKDGTVADVKLARSSGFAMLDDAATRTVRESWRFVPARVDGAPVASWVEVPIRFVLEDS